MKKVRIQFRRSSGVFFPGDIAGFDPAVAKEYIDRGIAVVVAEEAPDGKATSEVVEEATSSEVAEEPGVEEAPDEPTPSRRRRR